MLSTRDPLQTQGHIQTEMREWKEIFHANGNQKKAGVAILISDKIDFKIKTVTRDKEGHYIMIKGSIQEEDTTTVNIYAPNIGAPQYVRQMLTTIKGEINSNIIIVGDSNTPLTPMDRSSRRKINKETEALNDTLDQMDLIDIYRMFHRKRQNTLSSQVHVEHSPGQIISWAINQASVNLRKLKSYQTSFPTTKNTRLEINCMKKTKKKQKKWRLANIATKQPVGY